jgi:hypothetical protein
VGEKVTDFRRIKDWTVHRHNEAHESDLTWLKGELDTAIIDDPNRWILVVTHHAPSVPETSRPKHLENPWTSAFATDVISGEKKWASVKH